MISIGLRERQPKKLGVKVNLFFKWCLIIVLIAVFAGVSCTLFMISLVWSKRMFDAYPWLLFLLPFGGAFISWLYRTYGKRSSQGVNLCIHEAFVPKKIIELRMGVLVYIGTIATHLFGGSAGREGTAVQMGATFADQISEPLKVSKDDRKIIIRAGMASGFAALFGTPLAGGFFGLTVIGLDHYKHQPHYMLRVIVCFTSALLANQVAHLLHIPHSLYKAPQVDYSHWQSYLSCILAGVAFGLAAILFAAAVHKFAHFFKLASKNTSIQSIIAGCCVIALVYLLDTRMYLGLGVDVIQRSLEEQLSFKDSFLKLLFTTITLGGGFKGGEVTPLFFIGATLGNALQTILPATPYLLAGVGFTGVFAGATKTPLACAVMCMELLGPGIGVFAFITCYTSYFMSGKHGIYSAQQELKYL